MENNKGTLITSPIRPFSDQDKYPTAYSNELLGGLKIVIDNDERNNIPFERRIEGETCFVINENKTYRLSGGITNANWILIDSIGTQNQIKRGDGSLTEAGTNLQYLAGDGSLILFPTFLSSDQLIANMYNGTGNTVPSFNVVYINGVHGNLPSLALAQANIESTSSKTYAVTLNSINNGNNGIVVTDGKLKNVNTLAYNEGDQLWLSSTIAGGVTTIKPIAPNHAVFIGTVTRAHQTQGEVQIRIQNGFELKELHDVLIETPIDNQSLVYDNSTSLWKNSSKYLDWFTFIWKLFTGFTIEELRLLTNSQLSLVSSFSCVEQGKKGQWYYDSTDTTSTDNTGTILVTTSGKRIKRRNPYDFVRLSWFILDYNADNTSICTYVFNNFTRVYLAKGETVKISSVQVDNSVELFGLGKIFKLANTELAVLEVNTDNFKYYNVEIDGNRDNQTSLTSRGINTFSNLINLDIQNSNIINSYAEGIRVQSVSNVKIIGNSIINCNQSGNTKGIIIRHQYGNAENIRIEDNIIDNRLSKNGGIAIQVAHTPYICKDLRIKNNTVLMGEVGDNSQTGFSKESLGIELYSGYGLDNNGLIDTFEITDNIIECQGIGIYDGLISSKYAYGISLGGASFNGVNGGIRNGTVINNKVKGCRRLSYEIIASEVIVSSNIALDSGEVSINSQDVDGGLKNIQFVNNILKNIGGVLGYSQIRLQSGLNSLYNIKVNGNNIDGGTESNDSIILIGTNADADKSNFYDIEIIGNTLYNNPKSPINIRDTTNVFGITIKDNIVTMNNTNNVGAIIYSAKTSTDATIINNKFRTSNISNNYYAIQVTNGNNHKNLSVINNQCDKFSRGLSTSGNIDSILYYGNNFKNCSVYALNLQDSPINIITGANIYYGNTTNELISSTATITATFGQAIKNVIYTQGTGLIPISGAITVTNTKHGIIGSGITTLSTINGGQTGQLLIIYPNSNTDTILVKDGTGNLRLSGDFIMNHNQDRLMLEYDGGNWIELSRSDNAEEQSGRTTLVAGTKTFTIEGLTSTSNVILSKFVGGGTHNTTLYYRAIPSTDSLTINALTSADEVNTTDTSTLIYKVL